MTPSTSRATQKGRLIQFSTPVPEFGPDVLLVSALSGEEEVSGLFHFKLELLYEHTPQGPLKLPLPLEKLLGKPVSIGLHQILKGGQDAGVDRYFHGIVSRVLEVRKDNRFLHLAAEVVPWLWLLTQKTNCRVFQGQNVPDMVKTIVDEWKAVYPDAMKGTKDHPALDASGLLGTYTAFDHCIQYSETDFQFISRLLEEEGISYFFDHGENGHSLVLLDHNVSCKPFSTNKLVYQPESGTGETDSMVAEFKKQIALLSGKYSARDHHFQLTGNTLGVENTQSDPGLAATFDPLEIYEYPGGYAKRFNNPEQRLNQVSGEGEKLARVRTEEDQLAQRIFAGHSTCRKFAAGGKFTLASHFDSDADGDYIATSVKCMISQSPDFISNKAAGSPYRSDFLCVPVGVPIRPLRVTPKPLIAGPQTAVVSVKQGEESWIDKFGRVRVQFPWEREGKDNETSACWVRVAQVWAGAGWGAHFWPRLGQEVVVEFLEGDPDRPIVTGSVYNSRNAPPYALPIHYTRSGFISRSSKDGNNNNFNEIRFEDKKGQEQIFLNAEKDMDHRVENDHRVFVGASEHLSVAGPRNVSVGGDQSSEFLQNRMETVSGTLSLQVGGQHQTVRQVYTLRAGDEIHLKSDAQIVIDGGSRVSIKGPGGFIDISSSGISIVGNVVDINSGGSSAPGTEAKPQNPKKPDIADDGAKGTKLT